MLDTDTKRRIDTARDVLVGKVPDPKSQVEQITIALIYKFMDDIDAQSEEWGGKRKFFAGDFARYGWARLIHRGLGGHEILNLYSEAIDRMPQNPGIPQLFRDIFENAYLPYRDPQTLRTFLEIIDEFSYDHSERLGDAFEYLLSVLGSQGDAGQFRTPRHIIDFIVAVIDPKKDETLLDPACGTAGFLISSYKHVLAINADDHGNSTLTPDEKARLAANVKGYDISPDMVRLSLVNMYLHDFVDPHIFEYDTLTSEERWHEYADVILANPPFMSPKGGIRPHNRFSVKSKRSEVLFVDYMAEHLTPSGRAGIIVPEGIIFQSQSAYKQLRRMLLEDYLVAVVSLPAGVFQPYSGVKTSILILDRLLAKRTNHVGFFKVENDGFDLGAQRREIAENDLPRVKAELDDYLGRLRGGESVPTAGVAEPGTQYTTSNFQPTFGLIAEKAKIAENGEYNLSGERYRESRTDNTKYECVELGDIILSKPEYGSGARKVPYDNKVRYVRITDITDKGELKSDDLVSPSVIEPDLFLKPNDLLIARSGSVGRTYIHENLPGIYQYAGYLIRFRTNPDQAIPKYVYHITKSESWLEWILSNSKTGTLTNINAKQYSAFRLPLPPLEVQREIVAEIEGYQKVIDGARTVVDHYRPHIPIDPNWPMTKIGEVCELVMDGTHSSPENTKTGAQLYITSKNVRENFLDLSNVSYISEEDHASIYERCPVQKGDVLYVKDGANTGLAAINTLDQEFSLLSSVAVLRGKSDCLDNRFLSFFLNTNEGRTRMLSMVSGVAITRLTLTKINQAEIPLPAIQDQKLIVAEIESEEALVANCRKLVNRFEKKIRKAIGRVWGISTVRLNYDHLHNTQSDLY